MSEEIKYEAVFGDQSLFDGSPEDAEYAGWFCQEVRWYMISNGKILFSDGGSWCTSDNPYLSADIAAMRRIIAGPKRWTVEDQKAGRLPEVGCRIYVPIMFEEQNVIYSSEKVIVSISDNGGAVTRTEVASINRIKPIETTAEKAKREEAEFVKSEMKNTSLSLEWSCIYERGLRAAYRKLKGGER